MSAPRVRIFSTPAALAEDAAERFAALAQGAVEKRGRFTVALSGGGAPQLLFRRLAADPFVELIPWEQTHVFWGDERCVPPDDPGSNYRSAREALLDHVPLPAGQIHRVRGEWPPEQAAQAYEDELHQVFGSGRPRFDLILLGLGDDGHTASLFPDSPTLEEKERLVVPAVAQYENRPAERVTFTLPLLNHARQIMFLVTGTAKADILPRVLRRTVPELPAARVQPAAGELTWWIDEAAAANLGVAAN